MRKAAGSRFSARVAVAVLLAATLAGCALYDVRMRESQRAEDEQVCTVAGHKPGTNEFATCLQERQLFRMRGALSDSVAPAGASR
jgi:hypothetical protein